MPLTDKQRHDAFLERQKVLGRKEMRGVWLTETEESIIKPQTREKLKLLRQREDNIDKIVDALDNSKRSDQ